MKGMRRYTGQFLSRSFALAIPFAITLAARGWFPPVQSAAFFRLLADAVLLTAFARLGVDVYIARCATRDGKVVASKGYIAVFHLVALGGMGLFLAFGESLGGVFRTLGISALVVEAALVAELARTKGQFTLFYLLKAPIIYIAVTVWVFAYLAAPVLTNIGAVLLLLAMVAYSQRRIVFEDEGPGWTKLIPTTVLSVLIMLFSWKEALFADQFGNDHALEILTFYTRFKLLLTFFFTLHNARVPNLMRDLGPKPDMAALGKIMRGPRRLIWGWTLGFFAAGLGFAYVVDPAEIWVVALILTSCVVLVASGNLIPVLNALDRQGLLITAHLQSMVVFAALSALLLAPLGLGLAVSLAALVSQVTLGLHLWFGLKAVVAAQGKEGNA